MTTPLQAALPPLRLWLWTAVAIAVALIFIWSTTSNRASYAKISVAHEGLAFACGYLAGQRGIIKSAGLKIPPPEDVEGCPRYRAAAKASGFNQ